MRVLRLLLLIAFGACNSSRTVAPDETELKNEFARVDSMAKANPDSAYRYFDEAVRKTTVGTYKGTWLQRMAEIEHTAGDYFGSNETALKSLKYFDQQNKDDFLSISYDYDLIGRNYTDLGRYDEAITNHDLAIQFSDPIYLPYYLTNKGVALEKKKQYKQAIAVYDSVLMNPMQDTVLYTRVLSNLAKVRWLNDKTFNAAPLFHEARRIREKKNDQWGLNASYAHLADFYLESNPDSARLYAEKMYIVAKKITSPGDQAEALEKLIRLSAGENAKGYFSEYDLLTDSIHLARANASNQFADIRFEAEKSRADKLSLEKEITQKKIRITRQRIILYGMLALFTLIVVAGVRWYRKRKRFQELQTKNAIRESELKTSQKVHDVVANGLYRIMTDLEHKENMPKETLLDSIENLYEQSRDISYEHPGVSTSEFPAELNTILTSFATEATKVLVVGNQDSLWKNVNGQVKEELVYVLQELMVNMKKHSGANNVVLRFRHTGREITVHYKDDGKGLTPGYQEGNGMRNTGNRIKSIGGRIIFDTNPGKGLNIEISVPLSTSK